MIDADVEAAFDAGQWREVIDRLGPHLAEHPDDLRALCLLAASQRRLGRLEAALATTTRARAVDANDAWALGITVVVLTALRRFDEARATADDELRRHPDSVNAHYRRAMVDVMAGTVTDETVEFARRTVELSPADEEARTLYGTALLQQHRTSAAAAQFAEARRLDPDAVNPVSWTAVVQLRRYRLVAAARTLREVIRRAPAEPNIPRNVYAVLYRGTSALQFVVLLAAILCIAPTEAHTALAFDARFKVYRQTLYPGHPTALLVFASLGVLVVVATVVAIARAFGPAGRAVALRQVRRVPSLAGSALGIAAGTGCLAIALVAGGATAHTMAWTVLVLVIATSVLAALVALSPAYRRP